VDNRDQCVGDYLRERIKPESELSIVSAYFTIYAYEALREELEKAGRTRFLYGDPHGLATVDPDRDAVKSFGLNEDGGIELRQVLAQKPLARACAEWIDRQVEIKTIIQSNFLHGKLYHIAGDSQSNALLGSSNFTKSGLGLGAAPNIELNIDVNNNGEKKALLDWFDQLWEEDEFTRDAKPDVLAALERLGRSYAPRFVYYKTLYHVLEDWLKRHADREELLQDIHLHDTEIWQKLYSFQQDGATSAINRLLRYNGCIIADSVGLGKTWTALAVIKFFELRNERVLVLCPKRLEKNWSRYTVWGGTIHNPFQQDRFNYAVRAHTDLSRYTGNVGGVDLSQFNWGAFDLVVIDESHNFRNEGRDQFDENGCLVRRSRYNRLLEEVLKSGAKTKVLMLSATPVNNNLRDLRNQIYLITEKRQDAFRERLGIGNIETIFGVAQRKFQEWENARREGKQTSKADLIERLGSDLLSLLDAVSLARSRDHIRRYYPEETKKIGGFPERTSPRNLSPRTDGRDELSYEDLNTQINNFRLALYKPSEYLADPAALDAERQRRRFDQRHREKFLVGMMRVNLLKRLESSVHSFTLTMRRMLDKMDEIDRQIEEWRVRGVDAKINTQPEEDEEDEEFVIGKGRKYKLDDLDIDRWQQELNEDYKVFDALYQKSKKIGIDRDNKFAVLRQVIRDKVSSPTIDKDGHENRKILVFTSFTDTAKYLYENLVSWVRNDLVLHMALVTGGSENRSTIGANDFQEIISRFSPRAQEASSEEEEIDIVIATDCLSEGQNLQDCDLVVNYDIHWNPVRLMQRFGRIDRLGSRNAQVNMTNFWPPIHLDRYLDLKNRVEARMALADATATGLDDPLHPDTPDEEEHKQGVQMELEFRDRQLMSIRDEIIDVEAAEDGIALNDLTLDDFVADLLRYIQENKKDLENAPFGLYAVVPHSVTETSSASKNPIKPGVIFCLKRSSEDTSRTSNRLWPYFLIYINDDGKVRYTFKQSQQCLVLFREIASGHGNAIEALEDAFSAETNHGRNMNKFDSLLDSALKSIEKTFGEAEQEQLAHDPSAMLMEQPVDQNPSANFTLITWLIIV